MTRPTTRSPSRHLVGLAGRFAVELEYAEAAVHVASVVEACERLLARVAALGERDAPFVEAGLGGEDPSSISRPQRGVRARIRRRSSSSSAGSAPRSASSTSTPGRRSRGSGCRLLRRARLPKRAPRARPCTSRRSACAPMCARTVSPSSGSVSSRKSSSPRRQTSSGATTRPFGVRINASQESAEEHVVRERSAGAGRQRRAPRPGRRRAG